MNTDAIPTQPVESSNIAALGYDWPGATLAVVFHARKPSPTKPAGTPVTIYHLAPIPKPLYEKLCHAHSIGSFYFQHIRNNPSITAMLWCDCGQFTETGEHLETCVRLKQPSGRE